MLKRFLSIALSLGFVLALAVSLVGSHLTPASAHSAVGEIVSSSNITVMALKHKRWHATFRVSPKREDLAVDADAGLTDVSTNAAFCATLFAAVPCANALGVADVTLLFRGAPADGVFVIQDDFPVPTEVMDPTTEGTPCELTMSGETLGPFFSITTDFHGNRSVHVNIEDCVPGRHEFHATELFPPFATLEAHVTLV